MGRSRSITSTAARSGVTVMAGKRRLNHAGKYTCLARGKAGCSPHRGSSREAYKAGDDPYL